MAKTQTKFAVRLSNLFQSNGKFLTIAAVAVILISGLTLISDPSRWWIVTLLVLGFFLGFFLLLNAAVIIKALISIIVTIGAGAFSFQIGATIEPNTSGAFIWMFGTLVVFFGSLTISYMLPSGQSRWSVITFIQIIYFFGVLFLTDLKIDLSLAAGAGIPTALILYGFMFRFGFKSRFKDDSMPLPASNNILDYSIPIAAAYSDYESRVIEDEGFNRHILWNERAYLIYPVELNQAFGIIGKKKTQLSYGGKPVNPWLRHLLFNKIPYRKARGADILLVLADTTNKNGSDFKVIGVSMPDSKAVVPVGIMPAKLLMTKDEPALKKAFSRLDAEFESYVDDLNEKQKSALENFGVEN